MPNLIEINITTAQAKLVTTFSIFPPFFIVLKTYLGVVIIWFTKFIVLPVKTCFKIIVIPIDAKNQNKEPDILFPFNANI